MPAPLRIHLTPVQEAQLRELETNPVVPHKVRRRAQAILLAAQGWTAPRIARRLGLDRTTLHRDLRRWLERGIEGLEDGKPPGARPRWTPAMSAFLRELLRGRRPGLPPASGGSGEALLRDLPPGDGAAEAPGDGLPVETDALCAHGETPGRGGGGVQGGLEGGGKGG